MQPKRKEKKIIGERDLKRRRNQVEQILRAIVDDSDERHIDRSIEEMEGEYGAARRGAHAEQWGCGAR